MIDQPDPPIDPTDPVAEYIWKKEVDEYIRRKSQLRENLKTAYTLVWGQFTDLMRIKLKASLNYDTLKKNVDVIAFLQEIKSITFKFEDQKYIYHSLMVAYQNFYSFCQGQEITNTKYLEQFNNLVDIVEQHDGKFGNEQILIDKDEIYDKIAVANRTIENREAATERTRQTYLGYALIFKSDNARYGKLKEELENDYTKGHDNYPISVADAFQMLSNYKQYNKTQPTRTGVSFAQRGKGKQNNNKKGIDKDLANIECYHCHKKGHYANKCPDKKDDKNSVTTNTNVAGKNSTSKCHLNMEVQDMKFCFHSNNENENYMKSWILLDNQSTTDIF